MSPRKNQHGYYSNFRGFNTAGFRLVDKVFEGREKCDDVAVVLVSHSMFTGLPAIEAAARIAGQKNLHLVLKNSSKNEGFADYLVANGYNILDLSKPDFKKHPDKVAKEFKKISPDNGRGILLLDHGGYGAYRLDDYLAEGVEFAGIVEYALNGQNRYERKGIDRYAIPYATMAEAKLKEFPDHACGTLIGQMTASEAQLHLGFGIHMRHIVRAGVIGNGRLGSKAADAITKAGAHGVMIYDIKPERMIAASQSGFDITARNVESIVRTCNIIVIGADGVPVTSDMFRQMGQDTIIAGVTSPDDTMNLEELTGGSKPLLKHARSNGRMHTYRIRGDRNNHFVHLICNGEAPNLNGSPFGVNDPTLFMPLTLHALMGLELLQKERLSASDLAEMELRVKTDYLEVYQFLIDDPRRIAPNFREGGR